MDEKAALDKGQSEFSQFKWAFILGMVALIIVIGIISSRSIHGILLKQSSSAVSSQAQNSQPGH